MLVTASDLVDETTDHGLLIPMMQQAGAATETKAAMTLADPVTSPAAIWRNAPSAASMWWCRKTSEASCINHRFMYGPQRWNAWTIAPCS